MPFDHRAMLEKLRRREFVSVGATAESAQWALEEIERLSSEVERLTAMWEIIEDYEREHPESMKQRGMKLIFPEGYTDSFHR